MKVDKLELLANGPVQIRYEGNHRTMKLPGDGISDLPADAQATINAWWTPERVAAWQAQAAAGDDA